MGHVNQYLFLTNTIESAGRICEIGSKDYGNTQPFRKFYKLSEEYVGIDLENGKGVDVVQNMADGIGDLKENYFDLVICCSVLEHTPKPWVMAEHLQRIIRPGGVIYIAVPWIWRYHKYPDDYFRYSFAGIKSLFDKCEFGEMFYSTNVPGEFKPAFEGSDDSLAIFKGERKYMPYLEIHGIGVKQ